VPYILHRNNPAQGRLTVHRRPIGTVYLLKRAELAVRSCMEVALAEFELTPAQFLMLFRMRDSADVSAADLARDIGVRPQSLIGLIAPLERAGVLEREPSPRHRRILQMRLTAEGKKLVADAMRVAARIEGELLATLDETRVAALQEALTVLRDRAAAHDLHPGSIRARAEQIMRAQLGSRRRRSSAEPGLNDRGRLARSSERPGRGGER
jgi:DNA-binding MarR family transcriptional regulator